MGTASTPTGPALGMPAGSIRSALLQAYEDVVPPEPITDALDIQPRTVPRPAGPVPLTTPGMVITPATLAGPVQPVSPILPVLPL